MGMIDANKTGTNPLIKQAMDAVVAKAVPPDQKEAYQRIVTAGMKLAFDKTTHDSIIKGLDESKDPIKDVAVGTVGILLIMEKESKGTMPIPPMVPAGMTLVLHGLDYIEQTKGIKIDKAEIDNATQLFIETLSPKIGLTPEVMKKASEQVDGAMQNQDLMMKYKQQTEGAQ